MDCIPCQKKSLPPKPTPCPPRPCPPHPVDKLCYAEGYTQVTDACNDTIRFRVVSDPNQEILTCRITEIQTKLLNWIQRASPVTSADMASLNIFCFNSTLLGLENRDTTGQWVGEESASEFLRLFNLFKSKFSYIDSEVTNRLVTADLVNLSFVFLATAFAGPVSVANPAVGRFTLSGQFHVIDFGNELCIDWSNAWVSYPVVV